MHFKQNLAYIVVKERHFSRDYFVNIFETFWLRALKLRPSCPWWFVFYRKYFINAVYRSVYLICMTFLCFDWYFESAICIKICKYLISHQLKVSLLYCKYNLPANPHVRLLVGWPSVCQSYHNKFKSRGR